MRNNQRKKREDREDTSTLLNIYPTINNNFACKCWTNNSELKQSFTSYACILYPYRVQYTTYDLSRLNNNIYYRFNFFLLSKNLGKKGCPGRNGKIRK